MAVAAGTDDGNAALAVDAEEGMRLGGRQDGIDRDTEVAAGTRLRHYRDSPVAREDPALH